jgi:hypothetical protein
MRISTVVVEDSLGFKMYIIGMIFLRESITSRTSAELRKVEALLDLCPPIVELNWPTNITEHTISPWGMKNDKTEAYHVIRRIGSISFVIQNVVDAKMSSLPMLSVVICPQECVCIANLNEDTSAILRIIRTHTYLNILF